MDTPALVRAPIPLVKVEGVRARPSRRCRGSTRRMSPRGKIAIDSVNTASSLRTFALRAIGETVRV